MTILEKNLASMPKLKELYKHFANDLYPIESSKTGHPILTIKNINIHSKYDPIKEASRIGDHLLHDKEELDVIIIYGCGLGYVARHLYENIIKNNKNKLKPYLLYIEADIKMFMTSITHIDWNDILQDEYFKIFLSAEKEIIGSFIQTIPTKRARYYYHRPSYELNSDYYKEIQNYIAYVLDRKDMNTATFSRFQKLWTRNFIYNIPYYSFTNPMSKLNDAGLGLSAAVIAGGPTLEKSVEIIKKYKNNLIIIAVDTVYKYLIKNDITPDIIVTVDPQYWNYKYLENTKIQDQIIVTDSSVYNKIFSIAPAKNYFIASSIFPLVKYFDDTDRGTIAAGGSVATTAFDVARILGCENIFLFGLDLSFPERKTHFKGAYFEKNFLKISDYFETAERSSYLYLTHTNIKIIDSTNDKVFTDQKMFLFKKWFDREIPLTKANVFLPDLGGALLEGTKVYSPDLLPISIENDKNIFLERINNIKENKSTFDIKPVSQKIDILLNEAEKISKKCKKIVSLINKEGIIKDKDKIIFYEIEKSLFSEPNTKAITTIIASSAQDILLSIIENVEFDKNEQRSAWIKTRLLYNSILELSEFYLKCFKKLLRITKNVPSILMTQEL